MAIVVTITLGRDVQGNTMNPAGAFGLVYNPGASAFIDPSLKLWQETGAPFGSSQTVHSLASGSLPPGVTIAQPPAGPPVGFSVNQFGIQGVPTGAPGVYTGAFAASGNFPGDTFSITVALAGPPAGPGGAGCSLITITPDPVDDLLEGGDYTGGNAITFAAAGGAGPYDWDVAAGALPTGLALSSGGVLSGTPSAPGSYDVTIRATDANDCPGVAALTLVVVAPDPIVVLPAPPLAEGRRGWLYVQTFTAEGGGGGPFTFAIADGELPPGLTLSSGGVLAGLTAEAGAYTFTVEATDVLGLTGSREYTIVVSGLRIIVGGEDRTIDISAAEIELTLNRQASARLEFGDEAIPGRGVDVLIYARDGVTPLFSGLTLVRRVAGMTASSPNNKPDVDCVDYSIYFDDADPITIVTTATQYLEDVIAEIVSQSLAVYGITYDAAPTGKTVPPISWQEITVPDAFKRITDATGVVFRVRPRLVGDVLETKALDVFVPLDDAAPVTITDAEINAFDLTWQDPPNLPRNTVDLLCGPTGTAIVTQDWEADGYATEFEVDIQAVIGDYWPGARSHAFLGVAPDNFADGDTVTLGSQTYTWRASLVGDVAGEVLIGGDGNASLANLVAAIVGAGGGVYAPSTPVNTSADAYIRFPDQLAANALTVGVAGNSIALATTGHGQWYGEGGIPISTMQLGSDPSGAAGWTQGYIVENGGPAVPLEAGQYSWNVNTGRGTITAAVAPAAGTILTLRYLAVMPFHVKYPTSLGPGVAPITFRENHPEIDNYASGLELAQRIYARESNDRREVEVFTDVDGFLPGQELSINTTYRGGIVDDFLVAGVRIKLVNAELWEYSITAQEADEYAGSFVEQWKALTSGSGGGGSSTAPAPVVPGDVSAAGDVYTDGRNAFRANQSLGGHKLTFVDDPAADTDAATKGYVDDGDASVAAAVAAEHYIKRDGSVAFTGDQSMGAHKLTNLATPTTSTDAATKGYVDAAAPSGVIKADGSVAFTADQSMGGHKLTNVTDPASAQDAATKAYVDANAGGSAPNYGFFALGPGAATVVGGPLLVKPTGTTLTFIVGIGLIGTGDALVVANVQLTDLMLDDSRAVMNRSLVSFGGQHLFGLIHFTGLTAGKTYAASLIYQARINAAAVNGGPGAGQPFLICLDGVTEIKAASIETAEASSSGTFADLATAGPSVTMTIGADGLAAVIAGDSENRVQTGTSNLGILVSGANTIAAASINNQSTNGAQNMVLQGGLMLARLATGSTTFKLQYQSDGGSNTRYARWIAAMRATAGGTAITFGVSFVSTAEARASTAYGALTTADSVTLTTGTSVLVLFSCNVGGSGVLDASVAVDVSGATTIAAADGVSNAKNICSTSTYHVGRGVVLTVNAGSNTFALRYKASTGTATFSNRVLAVIRLN